MHLHKERPMTIGPPGRATDGVTVTLTRPDFAAIDLALRVLLAASTPRDKYFGDLGRAQAKLAGLEGRAEQPLRVETTMTTISPEPGTQRIEMTRCPPQPRR